MDPIVRAQVNELKGYVAACCDVYEDEPERGIPWSILETIQKKVDAIALGIQKDPVEP
jgi:hypothetical protein